MPLCMHMLVKPKCGLTDYSLALLTGIFVGAVGMVTDLFQFNLVSYGWGGQDKVLVHAPDSAITLQTGFDSRDTAEEVQKQHHFC